MRTALCRVCGQTPIVEYNGRFATHRDGDDDGLNWRRCEGTGTVPWRRGFPSDAVMAANLAPLPPFEGRGIILQAVHRDGAPLLLHALEPPEPIPESPAGLLWLRALGETFELLLPEQVEPFRGDGWSFRRVSEHGEVVAWREP
jgi:hypothetical protein